MDFIKKNIDLVVFDMAGTTVYDSGGVEYCFTKAAKKSGLRMTANEIKAVQGIKKIEVFNTYWKRQLGEHEDLSRLKEFVDHSFSEFTSTLEEYYESIAVTPTEGTLELFETLKSMGVKIALTTGFYRKVTNQILKKLGWDFGLDKQGRKVGNGIIDFSICSEEVVRGRPHPDMIYSAMDHLNVSETSRVINIGDTPSDLKSGKAANCLLSLGITNGTHTYDMLKNIDNDGLIPTMKSFINVVNNLLEPKDQKILVAKAG